MSIVESLAKVVALLLLMLCVGTAGSARADSDGERDDPATLNARNIARPATLGAAPPAYSKPSRLQCRIYFGCTPAARWAAGTVQQ